MMTQNDLTVAEEAGAISFEMSAKVSELIAEVERLQTAIREIMRFNPLRNDRDAYLLAVSQWGLNGKWGVDDEFTERPQPGDFGLE